MSQTQPALSKGVNRQPVNLRVNRVNLIFTIRGWRPLARLPPALLFATRKDPRLLRDTSPQQSPAAVLP